MSIKRYCDEFAETLDDFVAGVDLDELLPYSKREKSMSAVRAELPRVAEALDDRWKIITSRLFLSITNGDPSPGVYSFCQRSCFGNVMRLNSKGTAFNVSWHVGKLINAVRFDPQSWCDELRSRSWNPRVFDSWQGAICAVRKPCDCYLLLDPPYLEEEGDRKMTPCYPGHRVTCADGRAMTYGLTIDPLKLGLKRGFPLIQLTNYYSAQMNADVTRLAHDHGYNCDREMIGICRSLGNSAGRFKHGDRVDARPKPIECVWTFRPFEQLTFGL